jgi:hypothetical protein
VIENFGCDIPPDVGVSGLLQKIGRNFMEKISSTRINKIGMAIGFSLLVGAFVFTSARAEDHGHHHDERHQETHYSYGRGYVAPVPSYYYAPPANYYTAPEPAYYYDPLRSSAGL